MRSHRRYTEEEKRVLLNTVARAQEQSEQPLSWILSELGLTPSVYYEWLRRTEEGGLTDHVVVPRSPLSAQPEEVDATVAYAKAHPRDGCRRLTWMMVDEDVAYLAPSTVYRILNRHDLLYRWKRPEPGQGRRVPEATYPNEVWHIDLMYLWVRGRWYFLVTILDSYSRYIVHWELTLSMRADEVAEIIATALERVPGKKPRIVRDNGSQFVAREWRESMRYFEVEEIPIRARHPQSNGRIERYHHSSLQYLRPVDYYVGNPGALLADRKRKLKEAAVRRREVNRCRPEVTLVNGAAELGRSERGAEATAEAIN